MELCLASSTLDPHIVGLVADPHRIVGSGSLAPALIAYILDSVAAADGYEHCVGYFGQRAAVVRLQNRNVVVMVGQAGAYLRKAHSAVQSLP